MAGCNALKERISPPSIMTLSPQNHLFLGDLFSRFILLNLLFSVAGYDYSQHTREGFSERL